MNFIKKTVTVVRCPTCGELTVMPIYKPIFYCPKCNARYVDLTKILLYFLVTVLMILTVYKYFFIFYNKKNGKILMF